MDSGPKVSFEGDALFDQELVEFESSLRGVLGAPDGLTYLSTSVVEPTRPNEDTGILQCASQRIQFTHVSLINNLCHFFHGLVESVGLKPLEK